MAPVAPHTVLSATLTVAPPATSPAPEEEMQEEKEEEDGEAEGQKGGEQLLPPERIPAPAHLSQDSEAVAVTTVAASVPKRSWKLRSSGRKL